MSGLPSSAEDNSIKGVDVREQGNALRVATNTPHLVSLGTGRLSTAVTLHPIRQGRVTIGTDPSSDIRLQGTGVNPDHCRVENSHSVVTLYPVNGITLIDGKSVEHPTRLSQGCMITIGRSNYLRFNHPEEAKLMKSVLPNPHISMSPIQFVQNDDIMSYQQQSTNYQQSVDSSQSYQQLNLDSNQYYQMPHRNDSLSELERELDKTLCEMNKRKPPVAPRKTYKDLDQMSNSSGSDYDSFMSTQRSEKNGSKSNSIMAKVSKFEYYAKSQQKVNGKICSSSNTDSTFSPKVFSSNSMTVNTPAKDVLGGKHLPSNYAQKNIINETKSNRIIILDNNAVDARSCSYANVAVRNQAHKIDQMTKTFEGNGNMNARPQNLPMSGPRPIVKYQQPSPSFDRNPSFSGSPVSKSANSFEASSSENIRQQVLQSRLQEEIQKEVENERLEEILHMCAEYEKQISSGVPITPTEKKTHNKIITNGSLPKSLGQNSPNIIQTSDGYFVFDTGSPLRLGSSPFHSTPNSQKVQSNYENMNYPTAEPRSEYAVPRSIQNNYENVNIERNPYGESILHHSARQFPITELSSPVMIRKIARNAQNSSNYVGGYSTTPKDVAKECSPISPISSPYDNLQGRNFYNKPASPKTSSPRTRIKTTFAHKAPSSPQYFIFPSPPPIEDLEKSFTYEETNTDPVQKRDLSKCTGIEKQLSITEEIPMIDDAELTNDLELRVNTKQKIEAPTQSIPDVIPNSPNKNFEELRQHLMADIPELDEIGKEEQFDISVNAKLFKISENLKDFSVKHEKLSPDNRNVEVVVAEINLTAPRVDEETIDDMANDEDEEFKGEEMRIEFENLLGCRKKILSEIYELKAKLSEIRSQEDDILRELEMEKALLKGEYDSEIAILNIEQQKKSQLIEKARKFENRMKESKQKQDRQQSEMKDRVDVASLKLDRVERDFSENQATNEDLRNAQESLENERKLFEDTEFQHLEEEAEWLAYREDLQNEIIVLTQKIESQKSRILTLKSEATSNLNLALEESKILQSDSVTILNKIEELTNELKCVDDRIRATGLAWTLERPLSPEYGKIVNSNLHYKTKPRIGSGEFDYSPPSSDDGDDIYATLDHRRKTLNEKFFSVDQMSRSMIVDLGEKRNIDDLIDAKVDSIDKADTSQSSCETSPEVKEKKLGFWERNFDSLSRLKNKDKKNKYFSKPNVMSQSLNENMLFNNVNIDCDIGSFEKTNSLRKPGKSKESPKGSQSKIPTLTALGKMMRKDSFPKKNKDVSETTAANKENIDSNTAETSNCEPINKTRYIKNQRAGHSENRYLNRSGKSPEKTHQQLSPEENHLGLTASLECEVDKLQSSASLRQSGEYENVLTECARLPSQDDIDRISKVTLDAPLLSKNGDMNSLGRKTLDSLMEIEKRRMELLELKGCQVIENEREKILELKKRVQNEAKLLWESRLSQPKELEELDTSRENEPTANSTANDEVTNGITEEKDFSIRTEDFSGKELGAENENGSVFDDSTLGDSTSIDKHRHSQSDSYNSSGLLDDDPRCQSRNRGTPANGSTGRPLSELSDMSDNSTVPNFPIIQGSRDIPMRHRKILNGSAYSPRSDLQRPLTRYLPIDNDELNLRSHIESAGHQVDMCPHISIDSTSCRGYLHKLGAKFHTWSKRWFVFDRINKAFIYYADKSEKKPRGGTYFSVIEEVYLDHLNMSKSPNPRTTFVLKTKHRTYYLMAPSGEAARIWIDVIFTGAQAYTEYQ